MRASEKTIIVACDGWEISEELSMYLASLRSNVVIQYANDNFDVRPTLQSIISVKNNAIAVKADLTKWDQCFHLIEEGLKTFGESTYMVLSKRNETLRHSALSPSHQLLARSVVGLNLDSLFRVKKSFSYVDQEGVLINRIEGMGQIDQELAAVYDEYKQKTWPIMKSMEEEFSYTNIRISVLCPGLRATTLNEIFSPRIEHEYNASS